MSSITRILDVDNVKSRELYKAIEIFESIQYNGLPVGFSDNGLKVLFNPNSGNVFLSNSDCQCAMLDGYGDLYISHQLPYCEREGSLKSILENEDYDNLHEEDQKYINEWAEIEGIELELE